MPTETRRLTQEDWRYIPQKQRSIQQYVGFTNKLVYILTTYNIITCIVSQFLSQHNCNIIAFIAYTRKEISGLISLTGGLLIHDQESD